MVRSVFLRRLRCRLLGLLLLLLLFGVTLVGFALGLLCIGMWLGIFLSCRLFVLLVLLGFCLWSLVVGSFVVLLGLVVFGFLVRRLGGRVGVFLVGFVFVLCPCFLLCCFCVFWFNIKFFKDVFCFMVGLANCCFLPGVVCYCPGECSVDGLYFVSWF